MKKIAITTAAACFLFLSQNTARSEDTKDIDTIVTSMNNCVNNADADCAIDSLIRFMPFLSGQKGSVDLEQKRFLLKSVLTNKPNFFNKIDEKSFGEDVIVRIYYASMPEILGQPASPFLFFKYTFMRTSDGWRLTNFNFKQSGQYPPSDF